MLSSALDIGAEIINYIVWVVQSIASGKLPF